MSPKAWSLLAEHASSEAFAKHRATEFCCSAAYVKRSIDCQICGADHAMVERRLECTSITCAKMESIYGGTQCDVQWKYWECKTRGLWRVYSNDKPHFRGDEECTGKHRVPISAEVKAYVTKMDQCGVQPRHIWSSLRRATDVPTQPLGLPSRQQISDCVKRLRKKNLSRNTREAVKALTKEFPYYDGIESDKAFLFGPTDDDDGFPRIGKGSDADPFVLGVTTLRLLTKVDQLRGPEHFRLFHTDATFKLSDLGYPVITCGFSDRSRTYHLMAILVVSARTHHEYELALGCVAKLYQRIFRSALRVDAVLGDAEDAQLNAIRSIPAFSESKYLMCFFHVLYNVHKRTRHLQTVPGVAVFSGIMDMHFTTSYAEYCDVKDRVLSDWRKESCLSAFAAYFEEQWVNSRYWRWQIFHSPSSYAATNNPCEVFNATVKRHVQRKSSEICALLRSMVTLSEDVGCDVPSPTSQIAAPNEEMKRTAKWMLKSKAVVVIRTAMESQVRVLHILDVHSDPTTLENMRRLASSIVAGKGEVPSIDHLVLDKQEKQKASRLYRDSVKWSTRRSHRENMPIDGWAVDLNDSICGCSTHLKFGVCAHIIVARSALGLGNGVSCGDKLMCRRARKKQRVTRDVPVQIAPFATHTGVENNVSVNVGRYAINIPGRGGCYSNSIGQVQLANGAANMYDFGGSLFHVDASGLYPFGVTSNAPQVLTPPGWLADNTFAGVMNSGPAQIPPRVESHWYVNTLQTVGHVDPLLSQGGEHVVYNSVGQELAMDAACNTSGGLPYTDFTPNDAYDDVITRVVDPLHGIDPLQIVFDPRVPQQMGRPARMSRALEMDTLYN